MRALLAPLSPHEEVTLRRIALGFVEDVPRQHIERLEGLTLIERGADGWVLSAVGRQRYEGLPRPLNQTGDAQPDEIARLLNAFVNSNDPSP